MTEIDWSACPIVQRIAFQFSLPLEDIAAILAYAEQAPSRAIVP